MDIAKKRDRKANFKDEELLCLLEGIGQQKHIINCQLQDAISARRKRQAWERVRVKVNSVSGGVARSQEEIRRKWKDLKAAVMKEQSHQKMTGGGVPIKETPFKDLIMDIMSDRSESKFGIEVSDTDSFAAQTAASDTQVVDTHVGKRDRKANFKDEELLCLLEGLSQEKHVINCQQQDAISARRKREAWERVRVKVNSVSGGVARSQEDIRRKWKDLKAAVMKEQSHQKMTGGGGPIKETPFKDLIVDIMGDRIESKFGIEVSGTDSFVAQTAASETQVVDKEKRDRKANFKDKELLCLLEGISQEKDVINCQEKGTISSRQKREAWERVRVKVNSVSGGVARSQEEIRRKWKDLKAAVMKEQSHQKKTGGGVPIKETPFKDLIMDIMGDRIESKFGIEVSGTDSFAAQTAVPDTQLVDIVSGTDSFAAQTTAPDTQEIDIGLSTDEKYYRAFTICTQLALIMSKGTIAAFCVRMGQLRELCSAWTNENCTSHEADSSPEEALQMQTVQDIKLEDDDDDDDDDAADYKSDDYSTKPTTAPDDTERCETEMSAGHQSVGHRSELVVDSEDVQCSEYGEDCKTGLLLTVHESEHEDDGPVKCNLCEKVFEKGKSLETHLKGHRQKKGHTCTFCGKEFTWKGSLAAHIKIHHKPNAPNAQLNEDGSPRLRETVLGVSCTECGEIFRNASMLERHMKGHASEQPATCEVCGKHMKKAKYLREHVKIHEQRNFACEICGSLCTSQCKLNMHVLRHERKFVCSVCGTCCPTKYSLMEHMYVHTGARLHPCKMCGKKFRQKQGLQLHMRIHNNDRPFVCSVCGKRFVLSTVLKYHMRTHTGEKPYGCSVCNKRYHKPNLLREHMRLHSGEKPYSCKDCGKCFRLTRSLKKHSRLHTGEKICWCSVCNRGFTASDNLKTHMRTHTGEKPYACVKCECRFMYLATLKKHLKRHLAENDDKQAQNY